MASEIRVPRLGWSMEQGTFIRWRQRDGDWVKPGDPLYELEGDKAVQEIEALDAGVLRVAPDAPQPGTVVAVGLLLGCVVHEGELAPWEVRGGIGDRAVPDSARVAGHAPPLSEPAEGRAGGVAVPVARDLSSPLAVPAGAPLATASPRARRLARELGIDWSALRGSGRGGRVREQDVRAASQIPPPSVPPEKPLSPSLSQRGAERVEESSPGSGALTRIPITPRRRTIAERMLASRHQTAPVTLTSRADASNMVKLRNEFKAKGSPGPLPAYTDIMARLVAVTLRDHRLLAARWHEDHIILPADDEIHIGLAVDTDHGLLVPVLRDVGRLPLMQIAAQSRDLVARARAGRLTAAEMQGGVFTLTSLGAYGIDAFTPIINYPQAAILGLGEIRREPAVLDDGRVATRDAVTLSLTFDHRIVDGAAAARFLQAIRTRMMADECRMKNEE